MLMIITLSEMIILLLLHQQDYYYIKEKQKILIQESHSHLFTFIHSFIHSFIQHHHQQLYIQQHLKLKIFQHHDGGITRCSSSRRRAKAKHTYTQKHTQNIFTIRRLVVLQVLWGLLPLLLHLQPQLQQTGQWT